MATLALGILVPPLLAVYVLVVFLVLDMDQSYARYALVLPMAYILGSVPWGFLMALVVRGVDIREYGSGKTGMTNVLRTAGVPAAAVSFVLDLSKGLLAVFLARVVVDTVEAEVSAGLLALAGHNWSVFLGFKGGRGTVTGLGGLMAMGPVSGAIAVVSFMPVILISRYVSLGSIVGVTVAFFSQLAMVLLDMSSPTYLLYTGVGCPIIIWQHRDNIQRILQGTERRIGQRVDRLGGAPSSGVG